MPSTMFHLETALLVQGLRLCAPNAGDLGSISGQGIRSHMPQLSVCMLQLKILHATTKRPHVLQWRSKIPRLRLQLRFSATHFKGKSLFFYWGIANFKVEHFFFLIWLHQAITKNEIMPFVATWMDLEIVILSEVSQTEKEKYHIPYTWQHTPVFLPGESHRQRSLEGYSP